MAIATRELAATRRISMETRQNLGETLGWRWGFPPHLTVAQKRELMDTYGDVVSGARCAYCGRVGLKYEPYCCGSVLRVYQVCPDCMHSESI